MRVPLPFLVLTLFGSLQSRFKRDSVTIGQKKMLKLLKERYGRETSRRTLQRALAWLRKSKALHSIRRNYCDAVGKLRFRASNHTLSPVAPWVALPFVRASELVKRVLRAPHMAQCLRTSPDIKTKHKEVDAVEPLSYEQFKDRLPWNRQPVPVK